MVYVFLANGFEETEAIAPSKCSYSILFKSRVCEAFVLNANNS